MIQTHAWRVYRSSIWRSYVSYVSYVSVSSYIFMKCTCLCMLAYSCLHNSNIYFVHCLTRIEKWTAFVFICHWMRVFQTSSIWVLLNFTSTWKYIKLVSNIFRKVLKYSHIVLVHTLMQIIDQKFIFFCAFCMYEFLCSCSYSYYFIMKCNWSFVCVCVLLWSN